jgi:hypothetical protein
MLIVHVALKTVSSMAYELTRTEIFTHSSVRVAKLKCSPRALVNKLGALSLSRYCTLWMGHGL